MLDTSGLVAFALTTDPNHRRARVVLQDRRHRFHAPSTVVGESYTFLLKRAGYGIARDVVRRIETSQVVTIDQMTGDLDAATWDVIDEFAGVPLSYVDASIVALAREHGIDCVFSFDDDFRRAGLRLVPE